MSRQSKSAKQKREARARIARVISALRERDPDALERWLADGERLLARQQRDA